MLGTWNVIYQILLVPTALRFKLSEAPGVDLVTENGTFIVWR